MTDEARRNREALEWITALVAAHDLAGADRFLAANAVIRGAPLFLARGAPSEHRTFTERFGELDRSGARWNLDVRSIEQLDEHHFVLVSALRLAERDCSPGYAGLTGAVCRCGDGLLESLWGFNTAQEAWAFAARRIPVGRRSGSFAETG